MKQASRLVLALLLVIYASGISARKNGHYLDQRHEVSNQCCVKGGGTLCGKFLKSCCGKGGCEKYWWGQGCKEDDNFQPNCNTCSDECTKTLGGAVCGVSISSSSITCCLEQDCVRPDNTLSQRLMDRVVDSALDKATGMTSGVKMLDGLFSKDGAKPKPKSHLADNHQGEHKGNEEHFAGMIDTLITKLAGNSASCKSGKALKLSQTCVPDSMSNLIMARLF